MRRSLPGNNETYIALALIAIVTFAAFLRFLDIGSESYWLDEIVMVRLAGDSLSAIVEELRDTANPPVYILLSYAWAQMFGTSEAATRSLSALAGVTSILMIYLVGREMYSRKVGVLAALIMALSTFQVWYSQEYRYYAVFQLTALMTAFFYVTWLRYRYRLDLFAFVAFSIITANVHAYAVLFQIGLALHFLIQWRKLKPLHVWWLVAQIVILLGVSPRLIEVVGALNANPAALDLTLGGTAFSTGAITSPPLYAPLRTLVNFMFVQRSYVPWAVVGVGAAVMVSGVIVFALLRRAVWFSALRVVTADIARRVRRRESGLLLLILWLVCPIVLAFLLSQLFGWMYLDRFVIIAAPAWYLLQAVAMLELRRVIPVRLSIAVLLILASGGLWTYYSETLKDEWRETAAYVQENLAPGDAIAISYGIFPQDILNIRDSFSWYYPGLSLECYVDVRLDVDAVGKQMRACAVTAERVWLVLYSATPDGEKLALTTLPEDVELLETREFVGTTVYLLDLTA